MMRLLLLIPFLFMTTNSIYEFKVPGLDGKEINLADYKGKKIMIVNTASKCGYTPQYADLQKLYDTYKDKLVVIGFPANNFFHQEPADNKEIASFCQKNYGVTFPMAEKISVKGDDIHPIYKYLNEEAEKLGIHKPVQWNFTKFLLNEEGHLVTVFSSKIKPMDEEVVKYFK